jgi:MFS family permease
LILDVKGMTMALISRIIGLSLLTAGLGAALGFVFFGKFSDWIGISLLLACVGGIIGSIAGAAREIVARQAPGHRPERQPDSNGPYQSS